MTPVSTAEVIAGIYAIDDEFVNLYLVKGAEGYVAIDAGVDAEYTAEELERLGIEPDGVKAVLLTHSDRDHTAALGVFLNARVYLSEQEVQMIDGTTRRSLLGGNKLAAEYSVLRYGETLEAGGLLVTYILTPGHTPGSMCYLVNGEYLFAGDTMSLKQGKSGLFNSFYNMDDEEQKGSLRDCATIRTK